MAAVLRYRLLTNAQLTRLLYKPGMLTTVQTRTKWLAAQGYLKALHLAPVTRIGGSGALVYTLSWDGYKHLQTLGYDVPTRYNEKELEELSDEYKRGKLKENDVLIAVEVLCRQYPQVTLKAMRHEWQLKQQHVRVTVTVGSGEQARQVSRAVTPDGWVQLSIGDDTHGYDQAIAFEVDRAMEDQKAWRRKVAALVAWADGPYQAAFGSKSLVIAVLGGRNSSPGPRRS